MVSSPSVENYQLGKGALFFSMRNPSTMLYHGERDIGHVVSLSSTVELEMLAHFSQRAKMKRKDLNKPISTTPTFIAEIDEITPDNMALSSLGTVTEVTQSKGYIDSLFTAEKGLRVVLDKRSIGLYHLAYKTSLTPSIFVADEIVTGPSGEGTVISVTGTATSGTLVILITSGTFAADDALSGSITGDALAAASEVFKPGLINVTNSLGTVTYSPVTDYKVDSTLKDHLIGRFLVLENSTIVEGASISVRANYSANTYKSISFFTDVTMEGRLRFVSDNAYGMDMEMIAHRVSVMPEGDRAYIGDTWTVFSIKFEVLDDSENHPDSPYIEMRM